MGDRKAAPTAGGKPARTNWGALKRSGSAAVQSGEKLSNEDGSTWGPKVFWAGVAFMLGVLWYVIIYSGGANPHGSY